MLDLIGTKWAVMLLCILKDGPARTGGLKRSVEGISQKMLTQTLRELQLYGIVERTSFPEVPPRVEYNLTETGQSLAKIVLAMEKWVEDNYQELEATRAKNEALMTTED